MVFLCFSRVKILHTAPLIFKNTAVCSTTHKHRSTSPERFYMNIANVPIKTHSQAIMHQRRQFPDSTSAVSIYAAYIISSGLHMPNNEQHYAETSERLIKESSVFYACQSCYGFACEHNTLIGFSLHQTINRKWTINWLNQISYESLLLNIWLL